LKGGVSVYIVLVRGALRLWIPCSAAHFQLSLQ
jgi:hypothetical protein